MEKEYILPFLKISKKDVALAGGKGASLGEMTNARMPIPFGFVILASAFDRFLEESDVGVEIDAQLEKVNYQDTNSVDRYSNVIRDIIADTKMPKDLSEKFSHEFEKLKCQFVAVRSSATAEDSDVASWAGELETYLNTTEKDLLKNIKLCWSSLFTPRAIFYRYEKKLLDSKVSVAVVIQKMVQSEVAGIAFTVHPVTRDKSQMIIEAGLGLGEAVVSGQITPDSYILNKKSLEILDKNISGQERKIIRKGSGNTWVKVSVTEKFSQKISDAQIKKLAGICLDIEKHYKKPQDIEWAIERGKIFITQSRPITTL
ncbi:hypothetical protein C4569_03370 [Candidatus Parcubacteria bacterium]|nr:MAG: hypothetical protein C4569_03370 [Candidatus Parcubacteria bacterium]